MYKTTMIPDGHVCEECVNYNRFLAGNTLGCFTRIAHNNCVCYFSPSRFELKTDYDAKAEELKKQTVR